MSDKSKGLIFLILAALFGATVPTFAKIASASIPPISIVFLRMVIASILLFGIYSFWHKKYDFGNIKVLWKISLLLVVNFTASIGAIYFIPTSLIPVIYGTTPIVTYGISKLFSQDTNLGNKYFVGAALGMLGVLLATKGSLNVSGNLPSTVLGVCIVFAGTLSFSIYSVLSKKYQKTMQPLDISFTNILIAAAVLLPFAAFEMSTKTVNVDFVAFGSLLVIALFGTIGLYMSYQYAIKHTSPSIASLFTYIQPVFGVLLSVIVLGEIITPTFLLGGTLALLGAYIASK